MAFHMWIYDRMVNLGLALHYLKKYHKIDPKLEDFNPYFRYNRRWDTAKLELGNETFDEYLDRLDKFIAEADKQYGV